eukprot:TRINITY_DN22778_c0_g1_i1.p1 TRINITY_DN22778_c0_g1~~TRINITY_DN22778_c0_g1_i1.p1  ORF type:complete len:360 (+),score=96.10 TRINITY_DN22778_c0_g1_i1:44-1081(+)
MELFDAVAADDARRRRCKYRMDELARELWEGVERDAPADVLTYAANLVERRRGLDARGTLLVVCGRPGVGRHSLISGARDMVQKSTATVRFCNTVCDGRRCDRRRASRLDRVVPGSELTAARRRGEFLTTFRDSAGVSWGLPLEVGTFLADGGKRGGRTVVLAGPPEVYHAVRECLPCVDTGVVVVACPTELVRKRRRMAKGGVRVLLGTVGQKGKSPRMRSARLMSPANRDGSPRKLPTSPKLQSPLSPGGTAGSAFANDSDSESDGAAGTDWALADIPPEVLTRIDNSGPLGDSVARLVGIIEEEPAPPQLPLHGFDSDVPLPTAASVRTATTCAATSTAQSK